MKTKSFITLSICLLLFACGETKAKPTEKNEKQKQKSIAKTQKKEKILESLPSKIEKHIHSPNCGHAHKTANSEHVEKMAQILDARLKLANMLPEEIREKIKEMLENKKINALADMSFQLIKLKDYENALLIASNFLAHAETDTEKQMANSFYAILASDIFRKCNEKLNDNNKEECENIKKLLKESLENIPNNIEGNYQFEFLVDRSLFEYNNITDYDKNLDSMFRLLDNSINKLDKHSLEKFTLSYIMTSYSILYHKENYNKIEVNEHNLNRIIKYFDLIGSDDCPDVAKDTPMRTKHQDMKKYVLKYKKYRLKKSETK